MVALVLTWSPDDNYLAASTDEGKIVIWGARTGKLLQTLDNARPASRLLWTSDGRNLLTMDNTFGNVTSSGKITVWDVETGEPLQYLGEDLVYSLAWSPDGNMLASGFATGKVVIWEIPSGEQLQSFFNSEERLEGLTWSPDGKRLASGGEKAIIWDIQTDTQLQVLPAVTYVRFDVVWSPDGKKLAVLSSDGQGSIWNAETVERLIDLKGNRFSQGLAWSPQSDLLSTSYPLVDTTGRSQTTLWNSQTGETVLTKSGLYDLVWSPRGDAAVSIFDNGTPALGDDNTLVFWNPKTENEIRRVTPGVFLNKMAWSPDGKFLVIAQDAERSLIVLNAETGEKIYKLQGHADFVRDVAWSPRGDLIASSSTDGTVIIWEVNTP